MRALRVPWIEVVDPSEAKEAVELRRCWTLLHNTMAVGRLSF